MPNPNLSTNVHKKKQKPKADKKKIRFKNPFTGLKERFTNPKVVRITGLSFLLLSAYFLIAFLSFLFTWQIDFDKVSRGWFYLLTEPDIEINNWLGKLGALVSHALIFNLFGVSAFVIPFISFLIGFKLVFQFNLLPFKKTLKHTLFFALWTSVLLSFLFSDFNHLLFLGGGFGVVSSRFFIEILGGIGTGVLLLFVLTSYSVANFNMAFSGIPLLGGNKAEEPDNQDESNEQTEFDAQEEKQAEDSDEGDVSLHASSESDTATADENELAETPEGHADQQEVDTTEEIELSTEVPESDEAEDESDDFEIEIAQPEEEILADNSSDEEDDEVELSVEEQEDEESLSKRQINKILAENGEYDPTLELGKFKFPSIDILQDHGDGQVKVNKEELEVNKNNIVDTLRNYNIEIDKIKANVGPTVTLYEIVPAKGVRISKIKNLEDDIALSLAALGIRIIAPIPGRGTIGIEVPNQNPDIVSMKTVISSPKFQNSDMALPVALGKTISNETFVTDLAKMPHLLMAGATGQGKSVGLNCILVSLLYKKHPSQIKFVLVDPKKVELTLFNKIERHYLAKLPNEEEAIITDTSKVISTLNSLCIEMDQRYELLKDAQVRNLREYNDKFVKRRLNPENGHRYLPYIVLVVDEFADLIMTAGKEVEQPIARLAQLARAIGIHLIIATQRPSVNIITGTIKANFPSRIAFRVTAKIDSRTILDAGGADQLIGRGDMLFSNGNEMLRIQCAFVDTPEVEEICEYIGNQQGYPDALLLPEVADEASDGPGSLEDMDRDALFEDAARVIVMHQQGSASLLQRKLKLGYNRAGRIVDQLEAAGVIGPFEGSKARQVLIPDEMSLEQLLDNLK